VRFFLCLLLLLSSSVAWAADRSDNQWQQHPGVQIPGESVFTDEIGHLAPLVAYFGKPTILQLGYFHCPSLCEATRANLFDALRRSGLVAGRDFVFISMSIDPDDKTADAMSAKAADLRTGGSAGDTGALHYITGTEPEIAAVTQAAGFPSKREPGMQQFVHPAGLVILTPDGTVSSYLTGVGFKASDLRTALSLAKAGGVARAISPVMLICFDHDGVTGQYSISVLKMLRLCAVVTIAALLILLIRRRPAQISAEP
jgi:protein SCO1